MARISNPVSGGQCHLIHLTILMRFSWPSLAYVHKGGLKPIHSTTHVSCAEGIASSRKLCINPSSAEILFTETMRTNSYFHFETIINVIVDFFPLHLRWVYGHHIFLIGSLSTGKYKYRCTWPKPWKSFIGIWHILH